jgi:DNA-binding CsgD family transcriptional regulator
MAMEVIGREEELASIEAFLDRLETGSGALVLSGEPGIGKTILWEAGVDEAGDRFGRVLVHRSVEAEAALSFTGLSDLLAPVFDEVAPSLAPLRRRAVEVALLLAEPGDEAPDPRAIGLALLDVLHALAQQSPVVVALDDLQWLDPSSAGVLQIALRRLRDERVGVLATIRTAPDVAASVELERSFPGDRVERLALGPLSLGALHHLLRERVGLELTRPELARVQEASAGNPFFALELGRELVRTSSRPEPGRALPVPDSLQELLGGRLARLPTDTGDVVLFAAALARPTLELVSTAHGHRETVVEALDTAVREGVVELDGSSLRFSHPLLASICYEQAPIWKRRAIHGTLARTVTDTEERGRHMALSVDGPDAVAASYLDAAVEQAAARGATAAAAELSELAAELTPADPALARKRLLQAARFHRLAGELDSAAALLEPLLLQVPSGVDRADVLLELAITRKADAARIIELCDEALDEAGSDDVRATRILTYRSFIRLFTADVREGLIDARAALARAEQVGDFTLLAAAIARVGHAELWAAEITPGLAERGADIEERMGLALEYYESPRVTLARILAATGEIERAHAIFEQLEQDAIERGDERTRGEALWRLSLMEWYMGRWQRALEHATAALEIGEHAQDEHQRVFMGRIKALIEADLGLVDTARAGAEQGLRLAELQSQEVNTWTCRGVLGRLELALGDPETASTYLRNLPARALAQGYNDPTAPFWADSIETLILVGELEQARAFLEPYEMHAARTGDPWAVAAAARCRALYAAADGDTAGAFEAFEIALSELGRGPYIFERGRTLLCLGTVRRQAQQKKAAREALEQALAIFEELGARLWAEKAHAEMARISGRRASSDELTETEHRVAELAAAGRTNKEIAAELFMGVSTVEAHLSRVYRKLGVRSRTELAGRISNPRDGARRTRDEAAKT